MQYWIVPSVKGILGDISFCAATLQCTPWDQLIGWYGEACIPNIGQVVCNQRFLILPGVQVLKLASRVLQMASI
ncbi:MAG: DUF4338 domain-containing protein [Gammaproteobacteria bacterium]|nr:DUF4338 domain-containing protein [Gammaproteobacteria bacterium]